MGCETNDEDLLTLLIQAKVESAWDLIDRGEWHTSNLLLVTTEKKLAQFAISCERQMAAALVYNAQAVYSFRRGDHTRAIALSKKTLELLSNEFPEMVR